MVCLPAGGGETYHYALIGNLLLIIQQTAVSVLESVEDNVDHSITSFPCIRKPLSGEGGL